MKKLLAVLLLFFMCPCAAYAGDMPYVVICEDLWLLDKDSGSRLFLLPETYYARVDNMDGEYYYVTFNGVEGKVERRAVSTVGYHTEAAGTVRELRIDPKYGYFTEIKLKSTMDASAEDIPVPVGGSFLFLGEYPTGERWYYVRYNEVCGYLKAEFTTTPEISIEAFVPEKKEEPAIEEPQGNDKRLVKILIITGLGVVLVGLIILLFRPKRKGANKYYYEDTLE